MDLDLLFIMIFVVAILAIVLGIGNEMFKNWLRHKDRQFARLADKTAEQAAQYAAKAQKLEQRVRVLERIATDRGGNLAMEIEDLRDEADERETVQ